MSPSTGVIPNLQAVARTSCQISSNIRLEIKCTINVMHLNHPKTSTPLQSMKKLSSTKLVSGAKKFGNCWFRGRNGKRKACRILEEKGLYCFDSRLKFWVLLFSWVEAINIFQYLPSSFLPGLMAGACLLACPTSWHGYMCLLPV